jgi:hypothetical protein
MAYSKAKGSKGISGAQSGSDAKVEKGKRSVSSYAGVADGRPKSSERKQSAK